MGLSMGSNPRVPVYSAADAAALAAITSMVKGDLCYQEDTKVWYYYDGAAWALVASDYAGSLINLELFAPDSVVQGTWAIHIDATNSIKQGWISNFATSANADEITFKAYMSAGTYTIKMISFTSSDHGIVDVNIDGTTYASFDLYSAGNTYNVVNTDTGNVISSSGIKTISLKLDGKNGASSKYQARITAVVIYRTA